MDNNRTNTVAPSPSGSTIDIMDYWWILRRRYRLVLSIFLIIFALSIVLTTEEKAVFESSCLLSISSRKPMASISGTNIQWYGMGKTDLSAELKMIVHDENILNNTLEKLKAMIKSGTVSIGIDEKSYITNLTLTNLKSSIRTEKQTGSDLVSIIIRGPYANYTQFAANSLAQVYRSEFAKAKTNEALETKQFIDEQLTDRKGNLKSVNLKMETSSKRIAIKGSTDVYQEELSHLKIELSKAKERYTDKHPKIRKILNQINVITVELKKYPKDQLSHDEIVYKQDILKSMIKTLQELSIKADIEYKQKKEKALDEIQIIEEAQLGQNLSKSNRNINLLISAFFALLVGAVTAFIWEGMDTSIGKIEDVERITNFSVIAHIPLIGPKENRNGIYTFFTRKTPPRQLENKILYNFDNKSVAAEAYRTLRTNIQFATMNSPENKVLAITSSSPAEGKTLTSTNLSLAISQMGKQILLIEADLRRPQLSSIFKVDTKPGLSDVLIGSVNPDQAIRTATDILVGSTDWDKIVGEHSIDNLNILPAGTIAPNPTELVASSTFKSLIDSLKDRYDYIIIDTPPVLPVADASIIASMTDGTIFIYQSNTTSRHLLLRAIGTLQKNHANIIGIVINQLSYDVILPKSYYGGYGYSYGY